LFHGRITTRESPEGSLEVFSAFKVTSLQSMKTSTMKIEASGTQKMLGATYQTTWHHISENHNFNIHCSQHLRSHGDFQEDCIFVE
jgi:hypothetical protein